MSTTSAAATGTAPPSEANIHALLQNSSYSPSQVGPLESYIGAVCSGQAPYHFPAVRTLVKLSQLFPGTCNASKIRHCFLLALLQYPSTDLLALSYMVPQPPDAAILHCGELLDACQFAEFWKAIEKLATTSQEEGGVVDPVIGQLVQSSRGNLQQAILRSLALTYKSAPALVVLQACNATKLDEIFVASSTASVIESCSETHVVFKSTEDNTKRQRVFQEGISFQSIAHQLYGQ